MSDGEASPRAARSGDVAGLVEAWIDVTMHHATIDPLFSLRSDARPAIERLIRAQLRDPDTALFVSDADGRLRGFCCVRVDRAPPILEETWRAEITDLGVRPESRRRGIGRALARAAFGWSSARGIERVEVRVAARNRESQAFWRSLGFDDLMDVLHRRL